MPRPDLHLAQLPSTIVLPATVARAHLFELFRLLDTRRIQRLVLTLKGHRPSQIERDETPEDRELALSPELQRAILIHNSPAF